MVDTPKSPGTDEALLNHVKSLYAYSKDELADFHKKCKERNDLYYAWQKARENGQSELQINKLFSDTEDVASLLTQSDPGWQVHPDAESARPIKEAAFQLQGQIKGWWQEYANSLTTLNVVRDSLIHGHGIAGYPWNDRMVDGKGDIDYFKCDILGCFWDPYAESVDESEYFIRRYLLSPKKVLEMYGVEVEARENSDDPKHKAPQKVKAGVSLPVSAVSPTHTVGDGGVTATPFTAVDSVRYDLSENRPIEFTTGTVEILECWWYPHDERTIPLSERQLKAQEENQKVLDTGSAIEARYTDDHQTEIEIHELLVEDLQGVINDVGAVVNDGTPRPEQVDAVMNQVALQLRMLQDHINDHKERMAYLDLRGETYNDIEKMYPYGRVTIVAPEDEKVLLDEPNTQEFIPYTHLNLISSTSRIIDVSLFDQATPIEKSRRDLLQHIEEGIILRMRPPKCNPGGLTPKELLDMPGAIYNCDSERDAPFPYKYPDAPIQMAQNFVAFLGYAQENLMRNNAAMQGRSPDQPNPSGRAIENLQSAGMSRLNSPIKNLSGFLRVVGRNVLKLMLSRYSSARTFNHTGELPKWYQNDKLSAEEAPVQGPRMVTDFVPSDYQDLQFKIHINAESMLADEIKRDPGFILQMYGQGLFDKQVALEQLAPEEADGIIERSKEEEAKLEALAQQQGQREDSIDQARAQQAAGGA